MSKNYDLYPSYERKIDKWRRRITGYEKMKRDLQRQIQISKNQNKKYKEAINKIKEICASVPEDWAICGVEKIYEIEEILKEVSE